jgi:hypothetical protein
MFGFVRTWGQLNYGVQMQVHKGQSQGSVTADSIFVDNYDVRSSFGSLGSVGIFIEYQLTKLPILIRSEINYRSAGSSNTGLAAVITNPTGGGRFGPLVYPVYKSVDHVFDFPVNLVYSPLSFRRGKLQLGILLGLDIVIRSKAERETYRLGQNNNQSGISDVYLALDDVIRPINYFYSYGLRAKVGRFIATYRRDLLLTNSGTDDLKVWSNTYQFKTRLEYSSISLGYAFHWFDKKEKK